MKERSEAIDEVLTDTHALSSDRIVSMGPVTDPSYAGHMKRLRLRPPPLEQQQQQQQQELESESSTFIMHLQKREQELSTSEELSCARVGPPKLAKGEREQDYRVYLPVIVEDLPCKAMVDSGNV